METKNYIKKALPHLYAVIVFLFLAFAYFYPALEGKVLKANDSTVSAINSKEIRDYRAVSQGAVMDQFHFQRNACLSYFNPIPGESNEVR